MRKVDDRETGGGELMVDIVTTNVAASGPPKYRPTGTLIACTKKVRNMQESELAHQFSLIFHGLQGK